SRPRTRRGRLSARRQSIGISRDSTLQARLDAGGEGAKVADSLDFVVGKLDAEVVFEAAQKLEGLEAIDAQLAEEVVIRRKRAGGDVEVFGRELEDLLGGLLDGAHERSIYHCHGEKENGLGAKENAAR